MNSSKARLEHPPFNHLAQQVITSRHCTHGPPLPLPLPLLLLLLNLISTLSSHMTQNFCTVVLWCMWSTGTNSHGYWNHEQNNPFST